MANFFDEWPRDQLVSPHGLPEELVMRPRITMNNLLSPVAMRWYLSLGDKRTAGPLMLHYLEQGLRVTVGLQGQEVGVELPPVVTVPPSQEKAVEPPAIEPVEQTISYATAMAMLPPD